MSVMPITLVRRRSPPSILAMFSVVNCETCRFLPMSVKAMATLTTTGSRKNSSSITLAGPRNRSWSTNRRVRGFGAMQAEPCTGRASPARCRNASAERVDHLEIVLEFVAHFVLEKVDGFVGREASGLDALQGLEQD